MSTDRLTADERATYLIGQAFRRVMDRDITDTPAAIIELAWSAYSAVLPAALTPDECDTVMTTTGFVGEGWLKMADDSEADAVERFTVEVDEDTAAALRKLAERCTAIHHQRDAGVTTHGALTVAALLAMLAEDAGLAFSRPGTWQGVNMQHVLSSHGYSHRLPLFEPPAKTTDHPFSTED
jgi:hypothetical protein